MSKALILEYEQSLAALSGDDFQREVTARLQSFINDFQPIPANPQGDAGIDAISHQGEHAYCCYGLIHDVFKTNKKREDAIVEKFRSDLRRMFELEFEQRELKCIENAELGTILPKGQRIKHIELLPNWFDSHRILGPVLTSVQEYAAVSKCRYVEKDVSVVILGPKDLANRFAVDEVTIARSRQRALTVRIEQKAQRIVLANTEKFERKLADLSELLGRNSEAIESMKIELQGAWRKALAFEQELNDTLPNLHRELEANRSRILAKVDMLMISSDEPWKELGRATEIASDILRRDFDHLCGMLVEDLSHGEIARLIGECPVGWTKPEA